MRLYKRGQIWWVRWSEGGRKVRKSTGCTDKKAADIALRRWQRERADPNHAAAHQATVGTAAARFLRELEKTCRSDATMNMYECKTGHVVRLLGETRLADLTHAKVLRYTEQRESETAVPHTVHRELTALRRILKSAIRAREFSADIKSVMPDYAARYVPRTRFLRFDELLAICAHLEPSRAAVLPFIVATSARFGEAFRARRSDITARSIAIRGTKTDKSRRHVPMLSVTWPLVAYTLERADGEGDMLFSPWPNLRRDVHRACRRAGVDIFSANDLRRTTGTWLVKMGVPYELVAKVMGHASTAMLVKVYGQLDTGDVGRLIEQRMSVPTVCPP